MNKRQAKHLLSLAKKAILMLYEFGSYADFSLYGYHIMRSDYIWYTVEVNELDETYYFKIRLEKDQITYLYQISEDEAK